LGGVFGISAGWVVKCEEVTVVAVLFFRGFFGAAEGGGGLMDALGR